jgi:hypothetical protein
MESWGLLRGAFTLAARTDPRSTALATSLVTPKDAIRRTGVRQRGLDSHHDIKKDGKDPDEKKDDRTYGNDTEDDGGDSARDRCHGAGEQHGRITWQRGKYREKPEGARTPEMVVIAEFRARLWAHQPGVGRF